MSQLRRCFMPIAGLGPRVPIHVEENGWPTGPGRAEDMQARSLETMVRAVHDFRGTYGVTDYRWFDLRDHNSASANFQHHYGLLRDDYSPNRPSPRTGGLSTGSRCASPTPAWGRCGSGCACTTGAAAAPRSARRSPAPTARRCAASMSP